HLMRKPETCYDAASTGNARNHLSKPTRGHSVGPDGPIHISSREGNIAGAVLRLQVHIMRASGVEVSQSVANTLAASFSTKRFLEALRN
ncbi:hypothetical protein EJ02DRAFT_318502, partial [Clathrospora elynae]